jgi:hypothetical protein
MSNVMKIINAFIIFITILSCGNNCEEIPQTFSNYGQATDIVLSSDFKLEEEANVSNSS